MYARGVGRTLFAAILLLIAGSLNVVYGIGALDGASWWVGGLDSTPKSRPRNRRRISGPFRRIHPLGAMFRA